MCVWGVNNSNRFIIKQSKLSFLKCNVLKIKVCVHEVLSVLAPSCGTREKTAIVAKSTYNTWLDFFFCQVVLKKKKSLFAGFWAYFKKYGSFLEASDKHSPCFFTSSMH